MSEFVPVAKDEDNQTLIPSLWRGTLSEIVLSFVKGDFSISQHIEGVHPISEDDARRIEENIYSYGATLKKLPEEAWDSSVCQWMMGYWDILVDLFTIEEGLSDLVLMVRIHEEGEKYIFDVQSVHVP